MGAPLLTVEDLVLHFRTDRGVVRAVDGVSFALGRNEAFIVLGESGCGKSSLTRAIQRLLPRNVARYDGRVTLDGQALTEMKEERLRREVRWVRIAFVAQAAMNALNPVLKVGDQVAEPLQNRSPAPSKREALARVREVFSLVGVPLDFVNRYAFELSGGMRQRVVIAMALVAEPELVILDEPTSALDVLNQANIMNTLKGIKRELETSFVLITHDIATSSELADRVAVMYAGQLVEVAPAERFYTAPKHPYAQLLMASVPRLRGGGELRAIPGQPPSLLSPPAGCRFAPRCPHRFARCDEDPPWVDLGGGQAARCWLHVKDGHDR